MASELDVAAYTVLLLRHAGLIRPNDLQAAAKVLHLSEDHMVRAWRKFNPEAPRPLSRALIQDDRQSPHAEGNLINQEHRRFGNRRQAEDGTFERRCADCTDWFPATNDFFPWKDKGRGLLRSYCHDCWYDRQRRHYLSAALQEKIEQAGFSFVIEDDKLEGLACAVCDREFEKGDKVEASTRVVHWGCRHES